MKMSKEIGKNFHFDNDFWGQPLRCGFLNLYQIGEICCEPGYVVEEHEQSVYEVTYVISGSGYSIVDGERIKLSEGDVMVNSMNHRHEIEAGKSNILRYTYMGFRFNDTTNIDDFKDIKEFYRESPYSISKDTSNILYPFIKCIDELYMEKPNSHFMIRNYCEQIVVLAARNFTKEGKIKPGRSINTGVVNSNVYHVIRYVEENICDMVSIQELADTLGYNYTYLSHFFKDKTGVTLQRYISYKKIERAIYLLKYGNISVTQISEKLRYQSPQSFSKAFRRVMGVSPTRFLESVSEKETDKINMPPDPLFKFNIGGQQEGLNSIEK